MDMASRPQVARFKYRPSPGTDGAQTDAALLFELAVKGGDMARRPSVALCKHRQSPWLGGAQSRCRNFFVNWRW